MLKEFASLLGITTTKVFHKLYPLTKCKFNQSESGLYEVSDQMLLNLIIMRI